MRHVGMAALMRPDIKPRRFPGRLPNVAVEVAFPPELPRRRRKQKLRVDARRNGPDQLGKLRGAWHHSPRRILSVVVLRASELDALMGCPLDRERLAVEVRAPERQD